MKINCLLRRMRLDPGTLHFRMSQNFVKTNMLVKNLFAIALSPVCNDVKSFPSSSNRPVYRIFKLLRPKT